MGASLGCCGGPSADAELLTPRYHPVLGRCDLVEQSLLRKMRTKLRASWRGLRDDQGGFFLASPMSRSGSRYALDGHDESDGELQYSSDSNASATSGSRMLCDFYNLVLERDHNKFFIDDRGRRVSGAYLEGIEIDENHFDVGGDRRASASASSSSRRRRRPSIGAQAKLKPVMMMMTATDRFSNMSILSTGTSQTCLSDADYWSGMEAFMQDEDAPHSQTMPLPMAPPPSLRYGRRRSLGWTSEMPANSLETVNAMGPDTSPLLLFSPVQTEPQMQDPEREHYVVDKRPLSRGMPSEGMGMARVGRLHDKPMKNLWDAETDRPAAMLPYMVHRTYGNDQYNGKEDGNGQGHGMPHRGATIAPAAV